MVGSFKLPVLQKQHRKLLINVQTKAMQNFCPKEEKSFSKKTHQKRITHFQFFTDYNLWHCN